MIEDILSEVRRAARKFPEWPTNPFHANDIIGEEQGELTKALVQWVGEREKGVTEKDIREEAVQLAAMTIRFIISLDAGAYDITAKWHTQEFQ